MTNGVVGLVVVGGLVLAAGAAHAQQSLADVARTEQARRKDIKHPTKVYTNDDVKDVKPISTMGQTKDAAGTQGAGGDGAAATPDGASGASGAPAAAKPGTPGAVGGGDEAQWRGRMGAAREQLTRASIQLDAITTRGAQLAITAAAQGEGSQASRSREDAVQEAARLKADVQRYQQALSDLEEQAHKAGVPAGWLR
jgi:hypothetical protein